MIHNPLDAGIEREIRLPLYYTGLTIRVKVPASRAHSTCQPVGARALG
jgi:hypothetical protein